MITLEHGGDLAGFVEKYGMEPLDFSVNTNPLGMPKAAMQAAIKALDHAGSYPDPLCRELRRAIGRHDGVDDAHVLCGNGAADLIWRLARVRQPKAALLTAPSFSEYAQALGGVGCRIEHYLLRAEEDFCVREDILAQITDETDMLFLCEPGNPTGQVTERGLLLRILQRCAETGTLLVLDECFNGFLEHPEEHTMMHLVRKYPNLFILKAFTKFYALAGLRLGYCVCTDARLLASLRAAEQPWAVSGVAQAAGVAALSDISYPEKTRRLVAAKGQWLKGQIAACGCTVYGSRANYIFFRAPDVALHEKLAWQGVLIRDCANYPGLQPGYYRAAVRGRTENEKLAAVMADCLQNAK